METLERKVKKQLLISFSGGETSALMTYLILNSAYTNYFDIQVVFANTGQENEETLEFINNCDVLYNFKTVWLEAVIHHGERQGTTHRIVSYQTASRNGEPFEEHIKKYGIPNKAFPHCTRELKFRPIHSYIRSLGWYKYFTAIGIRTDEQRRVSKSEQAQFIVVYPLINWWQVDKQDVNCFWEAQPIRLKLPNYRGNCKWCWKKSDKKLLTIMKETPDVFLFPERMEKVYSRIGPEFQKDPQALSRRFFRGHRTVDNLRELLKTVDIPQGYHLEDASNGCSESCELYSLE